MCYSLLLLSLFLLTTHSLLPTQKEYLKNLEYDAYYVKSFMFLVDNHAFQKNQIYFMGAGLNDTQSEDLVSKMREMGWSATRHKVHVLKAERTDILSNSYDFACRVLAISDVNDNYTNYRSVVSEKTDRRVVHEMYAIPPPIPTSSFMAFLLDGCCTCFYTDWTINVIKLDMNVDSKKGWEFPWWFYF